MFMVGAAMAYSCAKRAEHGQTYGQMLRHAIVRSIVLVLLGVFLRSDGSEQTYWTFEDVLSQIGLGYTFLFLLWGRPAWLQWSAVVVILAGYWYLVLPVSAAGGGLRLLDRGRAGPIGRTCRASPRTGTRTPMPRPGSRRGS